jgi:hypothetical protein
MPESTSVPAQAIATLRRRAHLDPQLHQTELAFLDRWQAGASVTPGHYQAATRCDLWHALALSYDAQYARPDASLFANASDQARIAMHSGDPTSILNQASESILVHQAGQRRVATALRDLYWAAGELAVWHSAVRRADAASVAEAAWLVLTEHTADPCVPSPMNPFTPSVSQQLLSPVRAMLHGPTAQANLPISNIRSPVPVQQGTAHSHDVRQAFASWRAATIPGSATAATVDGIMMLADIACQPPWHFPWTAEIIVGDLDLALLRAPHLDAVQGQLQQLPESQVLPRLRLRQFADALRLATSTTSLELAISQSQRSEVEQGIWWDVFAQAVLQPLEVACALDAGLATEAECRSAVDRAVIAFGSIAQWWTALALQPFARILDAAFASVPIPANNTVDQSACGVWSALRFPGLAALRKSQIERAIAGVEMDATCQQWINRVVSILLTRQDRSNIEPGLHDESQAIFSTVRNWTDAGWNE